MNFIEEFKKGQSSKNQGIPFGPGLENLSRALNNIQRGTSTTVAAASKAGKSTWVDCAFILGPYLYWLQVLNTENRLDLVFVYFSFEMDRVSKEYDFACFFLHHFYGINKIMLPEGIKYKNKYGEIVDYIYLSSQYLRGRIQDVDGNTILCDADVKEKLKIVYEIHIVNLFGEYDDQGRQIKKGLIEFYDEAENPTGLRNRLMVKAEERGTFIKETFLDKATNQNREKICGYKPYNPEEYIIVVTDTVRKLKKERGFTMKENVDKWLEYTTMLVLLGIKFGELLEHLEGKITTT